MEATDETRRGASLSLSSASLDEFLDIESFVSSVTDHLGSPDLDPFNFGSEDMSPKWLTDIFTITHKSSANVIPRLAGESKSMPLEARSISTEARTCQNPQGLCISLATGLLKSMHASSPSCLLGMGSQDRQTHLSRAVDAVLSTNYEALRVMHGLLGCPCYESPQLQLLVTIICSETIAWYWRIIDTYSRHRNTNTESGIIPTERVETLRRSFFIGDQCLESHLEAMLISQVVSSRLQELEDLIADIAWNTEQSAATNGEPRSHPMHSAVHSRMDSFLKTQLASVKCELLNLQEGCRRQNEATTSSRYVRGSLQDNSGEPSA
ncbi:hypothetical protein TARUN_2068 [Trichoderma arundinaceum]|uniref:Aflatoxin regulatory protein domain-containing protein n=1 Tax=Trichoderma arundinaceum TaxID=490622 RepID=A0A395NVX9_TRIAR|nr:hypothetical protein TARUN_2068 [Trichoderma arundinaceum]